MKDKNALTPRCLDTDEWHDWHERKCRRCGEEMGVNETDECGHCGKKTGGRYFYCSPECTRLGEEEMNRQAETEQKP